MMVQLLIISLIAAALLAALMVVFFVGRTLQRGEIGRSRAMRERGIQCTAQWMRSFEEQECRQLCEGCSLSAQNCQLSTKK